MFSKGLYNDILSLNITGKPAPLSSIWISYLADHQIQMLKKGKRKRFNHFQCPRCYVLILRDTHFDFPSFFPLMWKDLRELPLVYHYLDYHLYSSLIFSKKNENRQNQKKNNLIIENLLSHNVSDYFEFIIVSTHGLHAKMER